MSEQKKIPVTTDSYTIGYREAAQLDAWMRTHDVPRALAKSVRKYRKQLGKCLRKRKRGGE